MDLLFIPRGPDIAPEELPSPQTTGDSLPCRSTGVTKARTGLGDSKETTAKKRVVTAARREQNKQAQRAYSKCLFFIFYFYNQDWINTRIGWISILT